MILPIKILPAPLLIFLVLVSCQYQPAENNQILYFNKLA